MPLMSVPAAAIYPQSERQSNEPFVPAKKWRAKTRLCLSAAQFFVTQYFARATFARSIDGKQASILWRRVPPHCPCGNSHDVAGVRLDCYAAAFYEQLTFDHEVVLTVRMFIRPRFRSQFPLKQRRLGPASLQWWHDDAAFRFVVSAQFGSRIFRRRVRSVYHCLFSCVLPRNPDYMGGASNHRNSRESVFYRSNPTVARVLAA